MAIQGAITAGGMKFPTNMDEIPPGHGSDFSQVIRYNAAGWATYWTRSSKPSGAR